MPHRYSGHYAPIFFTSCAYVVFCFIPYLIGRVAWPLYVGSYLLALVIIMTLIRARVIYIKEKPDYFVNILRKLELSSYYPECPSYQIDQLLNYLMINTRNLKILWGFNDSTQIAYTHVFGYKISIDFSDEYDGSIMLKDESIRSYIFKSIRFPMMHLRLVVRLQTSYLKRNSDVVKFSMDNFIP